jgi:toxin-antitoxin system, antitoxin component, xre family
MQDINRLKILLAEKKKTNKWLCEQLGVNPTTVSKWCTNSSQPSVGMILKVMEVLDVDIDQVINVPKKRPHKTISQS